MCLKLLDLPPGAELLLMVLTGQECSPSRVLQLSAEACIVRNLRQVKFAQAAATKPGSLTRLHLLPLCVPAGGLSVHVLMQVSFTAANLLVHGTRLTWLPCFLHRLAAAAPEAADIQTGTIICFGV